MTEIVPYTVRSEVKERTDGWVDVIQPVAALAEQVMHTEFVPKGLRGKPAAITAAILYGRELEMPPMQSLTNIHVVDGRVGLAAEHMRAMVFAAGHEITYPVLKGAQVVARGRRRGPDGVLGEPTDVEWNWQMAQHAGLVGKDNWKKYPRAMLTARATADLCRLIFPDVTRGMEAAEELDEDERPAEAGTSTSTTDKPVSKVSRAKAKGTTPPAATAAPVPPVQGSAVAAPPRPPLPAAKVAPEPAAATPGEGLGDTGSQPPAAGPARELDFSDEADRDLAKHLERVMYDCPKGPSTHHAPHEYQFGAELRECPGLVSAPCSNEGKHTHHRWATTQAFYWCEGITTLQQCPHISNTQQCRYASGHEGPHTFGGGLQDPVSNRRCELPEEHDAHAWNPRKGEWFNCSGRALAMETIELPEAEIVSEGDGSPDDLDATGGPVPDTSPTISPGALRALGAAFTSLGITDSAERHHTTSALLGRKVETWKTLTRADADKLFKAVENLTTRDQLEELVQRAAEEWGASDA